MLKVFAVFVIILAWIEPTYAWRNDTQAMSELDQWFAEEDENAWDYAPDDEELTLEDSIERFETELEVAGREERFDPYTHANSQNHQGFSDYIEDEQPPPMVPRVERSRPHGPVGSFSQVNSLQNRLSGFRKIHRKKKRAHKRYEWKAQRDPFELY